MATLYLAVTTERSERVFYGSLDNATFYKLRRWEEEPRTIKRAIADANGRARLPRWQLAKRTNTVFSGPITRV